MQCNWLKFSNILYKEGIKDLNAKFGKYSVMGNHDNWESTTDVSNCLIKNGFKTIDNNIVSDIRQNFKNKYLKYYKSVLKKFNINNNINKLEDVYKYRFCEFLIDDQIIEVKSDEG